MSILKNNSTLLILIVVELVIFAGILYFIIIHNTYTLKEVTRLNPETGKKENIVYRLNKRTGEVWELGTNIPVKLKQE